MRAHAPLAVVDVHLEDGLEPLLRRREGDDDLYAVFWWNDVPLGARELTRAQLASPRSVAGLVAEAIAPAVGARLLGPGVFAPPLPGDPSPPGGGVPDLGCLLAALRPLSALPRGAPRCSKGPVPADVSVVVATRRRPAALAAALGALGRLRAAPGEVIVVDNDPDDATRAAVLGSGIASYVPERRPGLSAARNAGIRRARGSVIAFTDDDALADERWLERLCAGFDGPEVLAVTGLVLPARLDSPAQAMFETVFGGLGCGFHERTFDGAFLERTKARGSPVWSVGAGVNLAVRREAFDRVGSFDERLGAGAAGCSEDSELLYRILAGGGVCRYRPDAVVRHHHRREAAALERLLHEYARGHVAALFVQFACHRDAGNLRRAFVTLPWHLLRRLPGAGDDGSRAALGAEARGYLRGLRSLPWALRPPARNRLE